MVSGSEVSTGGFLSAFALVSSFKVGNQLREFVVFSVKVGHRQLKDCCKALQCLQIGLVHTRFVSVDACAGDELVQASFDA